MVPTYIDGCLAMLHLGQRRRAVLICGSIGDEALNSYRSLVFLAEYANMILISALTAVFFFGGWQGPLEGYPGMGSAPAWLAWLGAPSLFWLFLKIFLLVFLFLWFRATFPRYRYDQIMRLGWKALIPVTLVWIAVEMLMAWGHVGPWRA